MSIAALQEQAHDLDIDLTIDAEDGLQPLDVDGERIAWVVVTLLRNAFRYAGRISVRPAGGSIHVWVRSEGGWVAVSVEDDGLGVPADEAATLSPRGVTV